MDITIGNNSDTGLGAASFAFSATKATMTINHIA